MQTQPQVAGALAARGPSFAVERAADSSPPTRGCEVAERACLWAVVWAGSLGGCCLRRLWVSLFTSCSEMQKLYAPFPPPIYNCLKCFF